MKVVPQTFYENPEIEKILVQGQSCVLMKRVNEAAIDNQRYVASHALTIVLQGSLQVENDAGTLAKVKKNQMIFLPKGLYVITDLIPKNTLFEAIVFFFDETVIDEFLMQVGHRISNDDTAIGTLIMLYDERIRLFNEALITLYKGKQLHQFTKPKLLELLHLIAISEKGDQFVNQLFKVKKKEKKSLVRFMKAHYDKPLDIKDYAYLTGRSVSTFRRDFKMRYGISPKKWLIEKRLQKAEELFKNKDFSVHDVAREVGYENVSHFIKVFQSKNGISPKQFHIKYRKEAMM